MQLTSKKIRHSHFAMIPPSQIQQNIVQIHKLSFWFGLWPTTEVRQIHIKYHIVEGHLIATFHRKDTNVMFYDRKSAETWLGKSIELSPLAGNRIIISNALLQITSSCECGLLSTKRRRRVFHVPEKVLDSRASIPEIEIVGITCRCGRKCHTDAHQIGNIHVWVK